MAPTITTRGGPAIVPFTPEPDPEETVKVSHSIMTGERQKKEMVKKSEVGRWRYGEGGR